MSYLCYISFQHLYKNIVLEEAKKINTLRELALMLDINPVEVNLMFASAMIGITLMWVF